MGARRPRVRRRAGTRRCMDDPARVEIPAVSSSRVCRETSGVHRRSPDRVVGSSDGRPSTGGTVVTLSVRPLDDREVMEVRLLKLETLRSSGHEDEPGDSRRRRTRSHRSRSGYWKQGIVASLPLSRLDLPARLFGGRRCVHAPEHTAYIGPCQLRVEFLCDDGPREASHRSSAPPTETTSFVS